MKSFTFWMNRALSLKDFKCIDNNRYDLDICTCKYSCQCKMSNLLKLHWRFLCTRLCWVRRGGYSFCEGQCPLCNCFAVSCLAWRHPQMVESTSWPAPLWIGTFIQSAHHDHMPHNIPLWNSQSHSFVWPMDISSQYPCQYSALSIEWYSYSLLLDLKP